MYVLHDINMKYEDLTAQVDYIVITPACIYFIECKNLIGNITVNNRGEFIREYMYNGRKIKEGIYSPIRQAERHIEVFKKIWSSRNTNLINRLQMKNFDNWCRYIVVMANSKNILNLKSAPKEIRDKIVRSDNLVSYLQNDIKNTDKDMLSKEKEMKENAFSFMENYNIEIERDYEEEIRQYLKKSMLKNESVDTHKDNNMEDLRKRLIEFRKKTSKEKNIPAYYIFNNEELEELLELRPKDIQELKNSKILSDIKTKIHGQNIINIINKN